MSNEIWSDSNKGLAVVSVGGCCARCGFRGRVYHFVIAVCGVQSPVSAVVNYCDCCLAEFTVGWVQIGQDGAPKHSGVAAAVAAAAARNTLQGETLVYARGKKTVVGCQVKCARCHSDEYGFKVDLAHRKIEFCMLCFAEMFMAAVARNSPW